MPERHGSDRPGRPGWDRVGVARFETFLRRLLAVKGAVAPHVEPRLTPVLAVEGADQPDHDFLRGTRRACWGANWSHGGAAFPEASLFAGLGTLCIVDRFIIASGINCELRVNVGGGLPNVVVGPPSEPNIIDNGWLPLVVPQARLDVGSGAAVSLVANYIPILLTAGVPQTIEGPWILRGSQALNWQGDTLGPATVRLAVFFRERQLEPTDE